jgi:hypothetical protein
MQSLLSLRRRLCVCGVCMAVVSLSNSSHSFARTELVQDSTRNSVQTMTVTDFDDLSLEQLLEIQISDMVIRDVEPPPPAVRPATTDSRVSGNSPASRARSGNWNRATSRQLKRQVCTCNCANCSKIVPERLQQKPLH